MSRPFEPRKFLSVADEIVKVGASEARLRIAVGRAYYACFLVARDWTQIKDHDRVHTEVIETFKKFHPDLADILAQLKSYRVVADYQMIPTNRQFQDWTQNWPHVKNRAEYFLAEMDKLEPMRRP